MSLLGSILFGNQNKPKSSSTSYAVQQERDRAARQKKAEAEERARRTASLDKRRESQKKAWHDAIYSTGSDGSGEGYGEGYGEDGGDYGDVGDMGSADGSADGTEKKTSTMSEAERKAIDNMRDSNIPYTYKIDENDLMYIAASQKQDDYWKLKEEVFIYTVHDRKKHRYITSFQIDSDKNDIVTSCQIDMPYSHKLMEYWIPGKTAFMIMGGTFDREVLFVGRVSEVNQVGDYIQVIGQNIGWKFKQYMSQKFFDKIITLPVTTVVKAIFKELKFTEGKYHIDLWGIPNIENYTIDENGSVLCNEETVYNVPDLTEVVSRMQNADINKYVAKHSKVRTTEKVAEDYNKQVEMSHLDSVVDSSKSYMPSSLRKSFGVSTSIDKDGLQYDPLMDRIFGKDKKMKYLTEDASGDSEYTYEDILHNIASAIDAHFYIVDTTVCFVSFNALMTMTKSLATQKAIQPEVDFWQILHDSYELDINQYGYYNTVIIKYKNGTLKRSYDDLVRVYDEIPITYKEPDLTYEAAQLKAQAYLAAHVRDFGMEIKATILYTGKIIPSSFIKIKNPLTMSENLFYVFGISVHWDGEGQTITCDLDLRYGPENPDNPEVPEYGLGYTGSGNSGGGKFDTYTGNVSSNIAEAARQLTSGCTTSDQKAYAIYDWVDRNIKYEYYTGSRYSSEQVLSNKRANCWDTAYLIYKLCSKVGVKCEVHNGMYQFLDGTYGHLWNKIEYQGQMVFADTGYGMTGQIKRNPIGSYHGGKILSDSCVAKNY